MKIQAIFTGLFCVVLLLGCAVYTPAQQWQDTLSGVDVKGLRHDTATDQRSNFSAGQQVVKINPLYKELYGIQSLGALLAQQSSVFVKSYGINSMATFSVRGASAAQSAVLWNGIPLLNPALGVADISLLRTGLFGQVQLQYGSAAALYGSGNVGGALVLGDETVLFRPQRHFSATVSYGSFGRFDGGGQVQFGSRKLQVFLKGFYQKAANDFPYQDRTGQRQRLANARLEAAGGMAGLDYKLNHKPESGSSGKLYIRLWWQQYNREIPPALFETYAEQRQQDNSLRSILGWEQKTLRSVLYAKTSYSREYLHYSDPVTGTDTRNTVHQYYQEAGWRYSLSAARPDMHRLLLYVPVQFAVAPGVGSEARQFRPALVAAYHYAGPGGRLEANTALRQEWLNGDVLPLLPGAGASYNLVNYPNSQQRMGLRWQLMANVQRTYRVPTLNELYYFPGGNPDLKPEQGWSQDGGYGLYLDGKAVSRANEPESPAFRLSHQFSFFNRNIRDWIYWLGGTIWTPHNIARVHSRGVETNNSFSCRLGRDFVLHAGINYTYVLSTSEASYLPGDGSTGKQIPYTPRYTIQGNAGFRWKEHIFFNYNQTYSGYRFITVDESQYLEPYATGNLQLAYHFNCKDMAFSLTGQVQNVFDVRYEVVGSRPMPGRNFLLQLSAGL